MVAGWNMNSRIVTLTTAGCAPPTGTGSSRAPRTSGQAMRRAGEKGGRRRPPRLASVIVERGEQRIVLAEHPIRIRVPEPDVERHQRRVPEAEGRTGLRVLLRAHRLGKRGQEGPVGV